MYALRFCAALLTIAATLSVSCSKTPQPSVTAPSGQPAQPPPPPPQPTAGTCRYEVSPVERIALPLAEAAEFSIVTTEGCAWRIETAPGWVVVNSALSGVGSSLVRYEILRHPGPNSNTLREAPLQIRWDAPTAGQNVWVRQMPPCSMIVYDPATRTNVDTYRVAAAGGRVSLWTLVEPVFSCPWSARSEVDWIRFAYPLFPIMARGDGGIGFDVAPNETGAERTGRLQVGERYLTVVQASR